MMNRGVMGQQNTCSYIHVCVQCILLNAQCTCTCTLYDIESDINFIFRGALTMCKRILFCDDQLLADLVLSLINANTCRHEEGTVSGS